MFLLLLSLLANAGHYVCNNEFNQKALDANFRITIYNKISLCEAQVCGKCFEITGKDIRRYSIVNDKLVFDSDKDSAVTAEEETKATEESKKKTKLSINQQALLDCMTDLKTISISTDRLRQCVLSLSKDILQKKLTSDEL